MNRLLTVVPPLAPAAHLRRPVPVLPFPLNAARVRLFSRARQALFQGLGRVGLSAGHSVLVPAYHHGAEIEAYARTGLGLRWYEARPDLSPDAAELEALLDSGVRALHLTHYLGFAQAAHDWRAWCDARGLVLIEDLAQGWLGTNGVEPLGASADLAVFSLRKSIGTPDGGAAVLRRELIFPDREGANGWGPLFERHLSWLAGCVGPLGRLGQERAARDEVEIGDPRDPAFRVTEPLVRRLGVPDVAERRRRNYRRLLDGLPGRAPEPFGRDPEYGSPHAFPLFVADKAAALLRLDQRGIAAVDAWPTPHPSLPVDRFPGAARRRAGMILLPVHQELRPTDLDRVIDAAREIPDLRMHERAFA